MCASDRRGPPRRFAGMRASSSSLGSAPLANSSRIASSPCSSRRSRASSWASSFASSSGSIAALRGMSIAGSRPPLRAAWSVCGVGCAIVGPGATGSTRACAATWFSASELPERSITAIAITPTAAAADPAAIAAPCMANLHVVAAVLRLIGRTRPAGGHCTDCGREHAKIRWKLRGRGNPTLRCAQGSASRFRVCSPARPAKAGRTLRPAPRSLAGPAALSPAPAAPSPDPPPAGASQTTGSPRRPSAARR